MRILMIIAIIAISLTTNIYAIEIGKITFEQSGGNKFSERVLKYQIKSKVGSTFDFKVASEDIKNLYSMGVFSDVKLKQVVNLKKQKELTFQLFYSKVIHQVYLSGNIEFDTEDVFQKINEVEDFTNNPYDQVEKVYSSDYPSALRSGSVLNNKKLKRTLEIITKMYKDEGFYNVNVSYKIRKFENNTVNIHIIIIESIREEVENVLFYGNNAFSSSLLGDIVQTYYSMFSWFADYGLVNSEQLDKDKKLLKTFYLNSGYLDFKVEKITTLPANENDLEEINVTYYLDEGEPYKIGEIYFSNNKLFETKELDKYLKIEQRIRAIDEFWKHKDVTQLSGDIYCQEALDKIKEKIRNKYGTKGYDDAFCKIITDPDFQTHTVNIELKIFEGQAYKVNEVNIAGNQITKDHVLRREVLVEPGDLLNPKKMKITQSRLRGLGYFKEVKVVSTKSKKDDKKNIEIDVIEDSTAKVSLGGGFSSADGFSGTLSFTQTNFDLTDPKNYFRGGGQRFKVAATVGETTENYSLSFTEPWLMEIPLRFDNSYYISKREMDEWDQESNGGSIAFSKRIFNDFTTIKLGYRYGMTEIKDMDNDLSQMFLSEEGTDYISALSLSFSKNTKDSFFFPTSGYDWSLGGELNSEAIGASESFYSLFLKGSQYYSLFDKGIVFHFGARAKTKNMIHAGDKMIPLFERYWITEKFLRGFPNREVSPIDINGDEYGGETITTGTFEIIHSIYGPVRGVMFTDAGAIGDVAYELDGLNVSAGYGLRIRIPGTQAPVKLNWGRPIRNHYGHDRISNRWRFSIELGFAW